MPAAAANVVRSVVIDSVTDPSMQVGLDADRVRYDRELDVRATSIVPREISLAFEQRAERRVAVVAELDAVPATGFTVLRPISVSPDTVTVRGPASELEKITRVATRRIGLEEISTTVMRDVPIELPTGVHSVTVEPSTALVTVEVDSLVILRQRLPVRITGPGSEGAVATPDSVEAVIRGAARAVRMQMESLDGVEARLDRAPEGQVRVPVGTALPDSGFVSVRLTPSEVLVQPGQGP